jgi:hypothetical protein
LPDLQYQLMYGEQAGQMAYGLDRLHVNVSELRRSLSGEQIAGEFHEVRHHEDGSFKSDIIPDKLKRMFGGYRSQSRERIATEGAADAVRDILRWLDADKKAGKGLLKSVADPNEIASHIWSQRFNNEAGMKLMDAADSGKKVTFAKEIPDEVKELSRLAQLFHASDSELDPQLQE